MNCEELRKRLHASEIIFSTSRSSGPGGQNVNKVNSRIELRFNIPDSEKLSPLEKEILLQKLEGRINSAGDLLIVSQTERSQLGNKKKAAEKFYSLISKALTIRRKRIPTSPTLVSKNKRLEVKRNRSSIKKFRVRKSSNTED